MGKHGTFSRAPASSGVAVTGTATYARMQAHMRGRMPSCMRTCWTGHACYAPWSRCRRRCHGRALPLLAPLPLPRELPLPSGGCGRRAADAVTGGRRKQQGPIECGNGRCLRPERGRSAALAARSCAPARARTASAACGCRAAWSPRVLGGCAAAAAAPKRRQSRRLNRFDLRTPDGPQRARLTVASAGLSTHRRF
eukprot:355552-Chlamydomonas_euryale.AAC.7